MRHDTSSKRIEPANVVRLHPQGLRRAGVRTWRFGFDALVAVVCLGILGFVVVIGITGLC